MLVDFVMKYISRGDSDSKCKQVFLLIQGVHYYVLKGHIFLTVKNKPFHPKPIVTQLDQFYIFNIKKNDTELT